MRELSGRKVTIVMFVVGVVVIAALVGSFVLMGRHPLERASRLIEARARTRGIASSIAACATTAHALPDSGAPGLACSSRAGPEAEATGFHFEWQRLSAARGFVRAEGDPTGEGKLHEVLRVFIDCHGEHADFHCNPGDLEQAEATAP